MFDEKSTDYDHMLKDEKSRRSFHAWLKRQKINWLALGFLLGYVCGLIFGVSKG